MLSFLYIKDKTQETYKWGKSKWSFAGEVRHITSSVKASNMPLTPGMLKLKEKNDKKKTLMHVWPCYHMLYLYYSQPVKKKKKY